MRTTIELPDSLFRRAKRAAVERGTTLKDLVTQAVEHELDGVGGRDARVRLPLPSVRLPADAPILRLTPRQLAALDAAEELARHHERGH